MNKKNLVIVVAAIIVILVIGFVGIKLNKTELGSTSNNKIYWDSSKGTDIAEVLKGNWVSEDSYYDEELQQCVGDGYAIFTAEDKVIFGGKFHTMEQRTVESFNVSSDNVYKLNLEPLDGYADTYTFDVSNIGSGILKVGNTTYKLVNKDSVSKDTVASILCNENNNEHKTALTTQEINEITDFLDVYKNNAGAIMQLATFTAPEFLFSNDNNKSSIKAICDRKEIAYKFDDRGMGVAYVKMETVKQQLKSLTNYDYSDETLKNYFSEFYNADNNEFQFLLDSSLSADIGTIKKGYKTDNKYEITLSNGIKIVLQKIDGKYYYYSSTGINS